MRPRTVEDQVRVANTISKILKQVGFADKHRRHEPAETPDLKAYLAALPKERMPAERDAPALPGSPFDRELRVGDRVPLSDGTEIEIIPDPTDEAEPLP
jgi:hypothetical protein